MNQFTLTIILHPSIPSSNRILTGKIDGETRILDGLISILTTDKEAANLLIIENDIRPGYLLLSNKIELKTTGFFNEKIKTDLEVRIIPISHGG